MRYKIKHIHQSAWMAIYKDHFESSPKICTDPIYCQHHTSYCTCAVCPQWVASSHKWTRDTWRVVGPERGHTQRKIYTKFWKCSIKNVKNYQYPLHTEMITFWTYRAKYTNLTLPVSFDFLMRPHEHFKFHMWPAPSLYWTSLYATLQQDHPARINLAAHKKDFPRGLRNGRYVHPVQFFGIMPIQKQSQTDNVYAGIHFGSSHAECKGPDVEPNFPFPPKQE